MWKGFNEGKKTNLEHLKLKKIHASEWHKSFMRTKLFYFLAHFLPDFL